jgi:hypothetical protein
MFNPQPKEEKKEKSRMTAIDFQKSYGRKIVERSKYNSVKQTYNGYSYDSRLEAAHAQQLDFMIKGKQVKKWERQHKISLDLNGIHLANYFIDFKVYFTDGTIEYHEVKGAETMLWRLKWRLTQALYPEYRLILLK